MNIDPNKVKELVLTFAELDEDYQAELMKQAHVLSFKQGQKNVIHREGKEFKNKSELEEEVEKRSKDRCKESMKLLGMLDKVDDTSKAELLILLNKLNNRGLPKKTDIIIQINEKDISMKEYIEDILPDANFSVANKKIIDYLKENNEVKYKTL